MRKMRKDVLKRVARAFEVFKESIDKQHPPPRVDMKVGDVKWITTLWAIKRIWVECETGTAEGDVKQREKIDLFDLIEALKDQKN